MKPLQSAAFISNGAIWNTERIAPARLKTAALLFDELIFVGSQSQATRILEEAFGNAVMSDKSRSNLLAMAKSNDGLALSFDIVGFSSDASEWPWDTAPKVLLEATKSVLSPIYRADVSSEDDDYEAHKLGGYLMSDIMYWDRYFSNAAFIGERFSEEILRSVASSKDVCSLSEQWSEMDTSFISGIHWDDVSELRSSPFLVNFRMKFASLTAKHRMSELMREYYAALEELAKVYQPSVGREATIGILGNIPGLPLNPIAVGASLASVKQAAEVRKRFGWVFFMREARELGAVRSILPGKS